MDDNSQFRGYEARKKAEGLWYHVSTSDVCIRAPVLDRV